MRRNRRRGEGCTEAYLEVSRVFEDLCRELKGLKMGQTANKGRKTRTFSAVPSSRRSKEHDAAMIAALLSGVV